jgi:uncharacterized short protein YbdD (DUF466 family)
VTGRLAARLASVRAVLARVLGVPDYEAYLAHVRAAHPDGEPLSREEYVRERLDARYSKVGARCC